MKTIPVLRLLFAAFLLTAVVHDPAAGQATVTSPDSTALSSGLPRLVVIPVVQGGSARPGRVANNGGSVHWDAFLGPNHVEEPDFYHLIGQLELERKAHSMRRNRLVALGVGALSMAVGTVLFTSGYDAADRPAISVPHLVGGFMIPLGGLTVGLAIMTLPHRRVPFAIAQELADDYNRSRGLGVPSGE